jgi:hypothetical protein|tara:strand:- start:118 stop:798 length:681 start_codon:yes stop_codon:yes gene_type:complete
MPNIAFITNPQNYLDNTKSGSYITQHNQFHRRSTMTNAKVYQIPLSQGKVALVSEEDYAWAQQWKWHVRVCSGLFRPFGGPHSEGRNYLYRFIARRMSGVPLPEGTLVDHWDGDVLNNCRENLRPCTTGQSSQNRRGNKHRGHATYKGIRRSSPHTWCSRIGVDGRQVHLGTFASEIEAAKAYDAASIKHFGRFANTNFPISKHLALAELPAAEFDAMLAQERDHV